MTPADVHIAVNPAMLDPYLLRPRVVKLGRCTMHRASMGTERSARHVYREFVAPCRLTRMQESGQPGKEIGMDILISSEIMEQIYKAFEKLGADSMLLAIIGSIGDTLDNDEVLELLQRHNETGKIHDRMICSVYDTPKDRRSRMHLVKSKEA